MIDRLLRIGCLFALALPGCGSATPEPESAATTTPEPAVTPEETTAASTPATTSTTELAMAPQQGPTVRIETSMGTIRVQLDQTHAPRTVANFMRYVSEAFYDGTIFHRVIDDFMIQGGGFTSGMSRKETHAPIPLEISPALRHVDGAIAMARTSDPNSATAQFYLCDGAQAFLDDNYAPFGVVIEGMDVLRAIASTPTGSGDVPRTEVTIVSVRAE